MEWDLKKVVLKDGSSSERVWNFKAEKRNVKSIPIIFLL